ncbi:MULTISPECIES: metallophosphoesterase [unclassified Arthrobacter]|uniref:metallophosphoesterase n=1 Tax=unclassified Arthrobacter TaxID=235627 RepID=UPI001C851034|nr:metallophosphoesterase [Arthrobacter sp. MAHUQ-56]MBX7442335.1 metallophosphoesterase [Arthrobacter sp. MAHUQ-56]
MPSKTVKSTTAALTLALGLLASQPAFAETAVDGTRDSSSGSSQAFTFAAIGDIPYGAAEIAKFPSRVQDLNADKDLKFVAHVGDFKNGSSVCSDEYFSYIRDQFDTFSHPLVYTPGDNEWVDCHRTNNGAYNPLERLDKLREVFFNEPGKTLGATMPVKSQANLGLPEDVRFTQNRVAFSVLNIQGSNNSLLPWTGLGKTTATPEQLAEVEHRTDAVIAQIRQTFADARRSNDRAVVLMQQADMFDPSLLEAATADPAAVSGFRAIVRAIVEETNSFDAPVYLINGDSHVFAENQPLAAGSPWLDIYGSDAADNLQRITVDGASNAVDYVRFTVAANSAKGADVLSWEKVAFSQ